MGVGKLLFIILRVILGASVIYTIDLYIFRCKHCTWKRLLKLFIDKLITQNTYKKD